MPPKSDEETMSMVDSTPTGLDEGPSRRGVYRRDTGDSLGEMGAMAKASSPVKKSRRGRRRGEPEESSPSSITRRETGDSVTLSHLKIQLDDGDKSESDDVQPTGRRGGRRNKDDSEGRRCVKRQPTGDEVDLWEMAEAV